MGCPDFSHRDLTAIFVRHRREGREKRSRGGLGGLLGGDVQGQHLLGCDADARAAGSGDVHVELSALPPQWIDSAEEAREDLKTINEKLGKLERVQQQRLLKVFGDAAVPDKEVQAITGQVSTLVRRCEQAIHTVKTKGATPGQSKLDHEFRENVQRSLATQLQEATQQFRKSQKEYLRNIRKRQQGASLDEPDSFTMGGASSSGGGKDIRSSESVDTGFNDEQFFELETMEASATTRNEEICQIASSIGDLHTIFKELAVLVIDQGSILDRIDYNIEQVVVQSKEANVQLQKAEQSQKSNRALKCMLVLVAINVVFILILILKGRS